MPTLLDLYCGAGGSAVGYHRAGFDIIGVDNRPQPNYPFQFIQADALEYLANHHRQFDAVNASPPCQAYSITKPVHTNIYPKLIEPTRDLLVQLGVDLWVIENVRTAPLNEPVLLCGQSFGLRTYRHRLFEVHGFVVPEPVHSPHYAKTALMGRKPKRGEFMHVVGNYIGAQEAREAMGIDWMSRPEMGEAVPPVYTHYIGARMIAELEFRAVFGEPSYV